MLRSLVFTILCVLSFAALAILILALTEVWPDNLFQDYKLVTGIAFITVAGLTRNYYQNKFAKVDE